VQGVGRSFRVMRQSREVLALGGQLLSLHANGPDLVKPFRQVN